MSKAVLVMDMPEDCLDCPLSYTYGDWDIACAYHGRTVDKEAECPLRPLPKRWIDADKLKKELTEWYNDTVPDYSYHDDERKDALIRSDMIAEFIELIDMLGREREQYT